jgi:hypothetical protein
VDSALWLLMWLRFNAWLRRLFRNAGTVRGALFLAAGVLFFALIIGPNIVFRLMQSEHGFSARSVEGTRAVGPFLLLAYCVLTVLFSSAEQGISFTPAEVQFLFTGPFSRRQVLAYKVVGNGLLCCLYAVFLTGFFFAYAARPFAAYPGLVLTLWFIQLFSMAVSLLIHTVGARAFNRRRKLLVLLVIAGAAFALWRAEGGVAVGGPGELAERLNQNRVVHALLAPMRWFVDAFTAENFWPDFVVGAAKCLAVDGALLLLVFLLDAQYLEAAAVASERVYARLQRIRSGGAMAAASATGTARFGLPPLPSWGGVGPLVWRQLTTAARSLRPLVIFFVIFAVMIGGTRFAIARVAEGEAPPVNFGWVMGSMVLGMTVAMLTPLLTFDFRGDVDRMDVLKALPLPPWRLAVGQLLAPTLLLSAVQLLLVVLVQAMWGGAEVLLVGVALFALPFNFLSFGLENLMFLWFPTRLMPTAPGDFQMMGRQTLMMAAKFAALSVVIVPAAVVGVVVYVVSEYGLKVDGVLPALAAACVVLTGLSAGVVPLVASAFQRFDVARDTPP